MKIKKRYILLILILLVVTISIIFRFLIIQTPAPSHDIPNITTSEPTPEIEILALSYPTSSLVEEQREDYFVNGKGLNVRYYDNLYYDCQGNNLQKIAPVDVELYTSNLPISYLKEPESLTNAKVFKSMRNYFQFDELIYKSFIQMESILSNKIEIASSSIIQFIEEGFFQSCTGPMNIPSIYIGDLDYLKTSNAKVLLSIGSNQTVTSANWLPIYLMIVANKEEDYIILSRFLDYSDIVTQNNLENCEIESSYGYRYIDVFQESAYECVKDSFNQYLDKTKLEKIVNTLLSLYAIN